MMTYDVILLYTHDDNSRRHAQETGQTEEETKPTTHWENCIAKATYYNDSSSAAAVYVMYDTMYSGNTDSPRKHRTEKKHRGGKRTTVYVGTIIVYAI